ncbi:MAG: hypothetical protein R3B72_14530 [Polyangiaceae bacterium]
MRRGRALIAILTLVGGLWGCPPSRVSEPVMGTDEPLAAHGRAGATSVEVRDRPDAPKVALLGREGDPLPGLVVAVTTGFAAADNAALAGLLQHRLAAAGHPSEVLADGAGLRVRPLSVDGADAYLAALAVAVRAPLSPGEGGIAAARERLEALRRDPLDADALVPIAACRASGAVRPAAIPATVDLADLERLRGQALVARRMAVAAVGPNDFGETVDRAVMNAAPWPAGEAASLDWPTPSHDVFRSRTVPSGSLRLEVAVRLSRAVLASSYARELDGASPLEHKLAALPSPWRLRRAGAVARAEGGCLHLVLEPETPASPNPEQSAAAALAVVERDVRIAGAEPSDAYAVTREIIEAQRAEDAAARAAWWVLSRPSDRPNVLSSALGTSADDVLVTSPDEAELATLYRERIAASPEPSTGEVAARRIQVEVGQGEMWLLVANPCAARHEGAWDAGRGALGVASVVLAARPRAGEVRLEPWVSADGVGILAHAGLARPDEAPAALAERLGDAVGRAYSTVRLEPPAFERAQARVLETAGGRQGQALAAFAALVAPDYPGWIAPWGDPGRHASLTLAQSASRWVDLVRGPTRVAILANVDEAQAAVAGDRLDRWLPGATTGDLCPHTHPAGSEVAARRDVATGATRGLVGLSLPPAQRGQAELTLAAFRAPGGPLEAALAPHHAAFDVALVGGEPGLALVVAVRAEASRLDAALTAVEAAWDGLASRAEAAHEAARRDAERMRLEQRASPAERLVRLWTGSREAALPDATSWGEWLRESRAHRLTLGR